MIKRNSKRIIAAVMCALIAVGAMVFNNVSAAEGVSKIDSYASLVEKYGTAIGDDGLTDGFVYIGTEFYEEDGRLTDYLVSPGDKLTVKVYIKSNMYTSDCRLITLFDNSFFDVKIVDDGAPTDDYGYTSMHESAVINKNHPMVDSHGTTHSVTSIDVPRAKWIVNICGFTEEYLNSFDLVDNQSYMNVNKSYEPYEMTSDEWVFSYYVHVRDGLAEGTKGIVDSPEALWQSSICNDPDVKNLYGKHDSRKQAAVPVRHITETAENAFDFTQMAFAMDDGTLDYFIIDDMYHEFVIESSVTETSGYTTDAPGYTHSETTTLPSTVETEPVVTRAPEQTDADDTDSTTEPANTTTKSYGIQIKTPSSTEVRYGDGIVLHAEAVVPEGARIEWEASNANFTYSYSADGTRCTIVSKEDGTTVFTAKIVDRNGNVLCEDEQTMVSKAGFIWKIIGFFKQLFGLSQIVGQLIKF